MTFPPTEITFHLLAMHPLGRDYRQDVLGMRNTDKFFVQEGSAESKKGLLGRKIKAFAKNTVRKLINNKLTDAVLMEAYIPKGDSAEVLRARLREKVRVLEGELQAQQKQQVQGGLLQVRETHSSCTFIQFHAISCDIIQCCCSFVHFCVLLNPTLHNF